jgi:deoxyadenosine/deoxycytidine kinase/NTP pyrophosphatase (non-canonical NTP hydrolase)
MIASGAPLNDRFYLAIEGPIGVGKTTLARILHEELGGQLLLEVFEENPFLSDFYGDRARYAFQTQIFFLLSRYRQQYDTVPRTLARASLVSDYLFAKDRLFACLNLAGDELAVYEHMHAALGEKIVTPGLIVHLRASTDVLMNRIATRDRSYERTMSRQYIDELRLAYERFFADYDQAPVLNVDTSALDFIANLEDRRTIVGLVRNALQLGAYQQPLPQMEPTLSEVGAPIVHAESKRGLGDFQRLRQHVDARQDFFSDLYLNFLGLAAEVDELGNELKRLWIATEAGRAPAAAGSRAPDPLPAAQAALRGELASVLASLLRIANDANVDLEEAYVETMGIE